MPERARLTFDVVTSSIAKQPKVIAVVLNYNGAEDTKKCVRSLQQADYANLEIILVDNASPDGSGKVLKDEFPGVPILCQSTNTGYAGGNNAGIKLAMERNAEYVLILNNDVIVQNGFLDPMVEMMEHDAGVGVVNAKVFYQSAPEEIFSAVGEFNRWMCTGLNKGRDKEKCASTTLECEVDYVCGVLLLVRREVFEIVGLLDERYFMYFEDMEFSRRVSERYRLAYTARSIAYHKSGGGKGWRKYTELYLYYHTRNRMWAFEDEAVFYRAYVVLFSLANALAKAVVVSLNCFSDPCKMVKQWKALCKGTIDGLARHPR